jgi:hypothetical protein
MVVLTIGQPVHDAVVGYYNPREKQIRWLVVNAIPQFKDAAEKPFQVFVTLQDITSRKNAEEAFSPSTICPAEQRVHCEYEKTG